MPAIKIAHIIALPNAGFLIAERIHLTLLDFSWDGNINQNMFFSLEMNKPIATGITKATLPGKHSSLLTVFSLLIYKTYFEDCINYGDKERIITNLSFYFRNPLRRIRPCSVSIDYSIRPILKLTN
jgi:hypothetical protein